MRRRGEREFSGDESQDVPPVDHDPRKEFPRSVLAVVRRAAARDRAWLPRHAGGSGAGVGRVTCRAPLPVKDLEAELPSKISVDDETRFALEVGEEFFVGLYDHP